VVEPKSRFIRAAGSTPSFFPLESGGFSLLGGVGFAFDLSD